MLLRSREVNRNETASVGAKARVDSVEVGGFFLPRSGKSATEDLPAGTIKIQPRVLRCAQDDKSKVVPRDQFSPQGMGIVSFQNSDPARLFQQPARRRYLTAVCSLHRWSEVGQKR